MEEITLCSYNVQGLRDKMKRKKIFKYLQNLNFDICLLQETHSDSSCEQTFKMQLQGNSYLTHGDSKSRGVAVLTKRNIEVELKFADPNGRYIIVQIDYKSSQLTIGNIYAPNEDDPAYFHSVFKNMSECDYPDMIIAGDFNLVINPISDCVNCKERHTMARNVVCGMMKTLKLTDIWRVINPNISSYTWGRKMVSSKTDKMEARLDFFLRSDNICNRIKSVSHKTNYLTDHKLIDLVLQTGIPKHGRGFWKFNTRNLESDEFMNGARTVIQAALEKHRLSNPTTKWEMAKCEFTSYSDRYSRIIAKYRNIKFQALNKRIEFLEKQDSDSDNIQIKDLLQYELDEAKLQIDILLHEQTMKYMMMSKTKWYAYGERNTKYFYSLAKSNYNNKTMRRLQLESGAVVEEP